MGSVTPKRPQRSETPILKDGMRVRVPAGVKCNYLTIGKEYVVYDVRNESSNKYGHAFCATGDNGRTIFSTVKRSAHIEGLDWIIVPNSEVVIYERTRWVSERAVMIIAWSVLILFAMAIVRMAFLAVIYLFQGI